MARIVYHIPLLCILIPGYTLAIVWSGSHRNILSVLPLMPVALQGSASNFGLDHTSFKGYNAFMNPVPVKLKRRLFVFAGSIALVLGITGIILPVLPTTPFLLLAALCYMRGSQRLYNALLCNRFLGNYIRNYLEGRGMPLKMKVWTLSLLWIATLLTATSATDNLIIRVILACVVIGVTIHIFMIKTARF